MDLASAGAAGMADAPRSEDSTYCRDDLIAQVGNDPALLQRLHGVFTAMAAHKLESLATAVTLGALVQAERDAHALTGSLAMIGAAAASALAAHLEALAQQGNTLAIAALLPELRDQIDWVARVLRGVA